MSSDIDTVRRTLVPFYKRTVSTVDGAADGTTVISLHVPGIGVYGLGEADGFWNDAEILILTGGMKDQVRHITDVTGWVRATGTLTVDHRFVNPNVSFLSGNVIATATIIPVVDASVFSVGEAYIWDAVNAETVTITTVDTTLNQLTLLAGLTNPYTVAAGAAISMSPRILAATQFVIMTPTLVVAPTGWVPDVNVTDRWARQLGQIDVARVLGAALAATNPVIAGIYDAAGNRMPAMDAVARPGFVDPIDRAARLLGVIYGSQATQLQQKALTFELLTEDTGLHTNPERWLHQYHWESGEVTIAAAGVGGQQNLGAAVGAGATRRIREITIRHAGTNNTVVTLLIAGGATRLTIDVPAQTTRVWSSEDGRVFLAAVQSAVQTSDVTGGSTYVSASGVEAV